MKRLFSLFFLMLFICFIYGQNDKVALSFSQKFQEANWVTTITDLDFSNIILLSSFDWQAIKHEDSIRYNQ
ncbi:MAG: hypothetical protein WCS63_00500, partial [Bacteroidales bacterium]